MRGEASYLGQPDIDVIPEFTCHKDLRFKGLLELFRAAQMGTIHDLIQEIHAHFHRLVHDSHENLFLVSEIMKQARLVEAHKICDIFEGGRLVALFAKELTGHVNDFLRLCGGNVLISQ